MLENKKIFIPGGAGSIGSELVRQLSSNNQIYILDINETDLFDLVEELRLDGIEVQWRVGDVRNKEILEEIFFEFNPQYVFSASALKHVSPSMSSPREYVYTNIIGTLNLLELSKRFSVEKFINISTDKAAQCNNVMGWSKKGTELFTQIYGFVSVRFGNVMGSRGSVIPIWQKQKDEGKPLTVTDARMKRYMMTIEEACSLVIEAAQMEEVKGKVIILDMGEPVSILDLAKKILGKDDGIRIIGMRPGEQLEEQLMSEEEKKRAVKLQDKFYII